MIELPPLGNTLRHHLGLESGPGYGRPDVQLALFPLMVLIHLVGAVARSVPMRFPPFTFSTKGPHSFEGRLDR